MGLGGKSSRERDEACQHGSSAAGLGGELIRSDDLFEAFSDVDMEVRVLSQDMRDVRRGESN